MQMLWKNRLQELRIFKVENFEVEKMRMLEDCVIFNLSLNQN
jgi:hypothetical protein